MSLLISGVLWNVVEIFSADDKSTVHLRGDNGASQDTSANRNETGERAFLICYSLWYQERVVLLRGITVKKCVCFGRRYLRSPIFGWIRHAAPHND